MSSVSCGSLIVVASVVTCIPRCIVIAGSGSSVAAMPVRNPARGSQVILTSWAACCVSVARFAAPIVSTIELLTLAEV
jgi:hypothetical protein